MEIITATESVALNLEYQNREADAESLRQNVRHILNKNRNMKSKNNLSKEQRKALKEIRQINNNTHSIKVQDLLFYQREMQLKRQKNN